MQLILLVIFEFCFVVAHVSLVLSLKDALNSRIGNEMFFHSKSTLPQVVMEPHMVFWAQLIVKHPVGTNHDM